MTIKCRWCCGSGVNMARGCDHVVCPDCDGSGSLNICADCGEILDENRVCQDCHGEEEEE